MHVNALMNGFRVYADAASRRFLTERSRSSDAATPASWGNLEQRLLDATFVTLVYTWQGPDGVAHSRTYYAVNSERRRTEDLHDPLLATDIDAWLDPWPGEVVASRHNASESRIPWATPLFRSDAPRDMQDAELKAVRSLERDLIDGVARGEGVATVFISRPACLACSQAMSNLANAYHISLVANEVVMSAPLARSQAADLFRAKRRAYLATVRSSLPSWATLRPDGLAAPQGTSSLMCLVAPRIEPHAAASYSYPEHSATKTLVKAYARKGAPLGYLQSFSDERYARWVLVDTASPYSDRDDASLKPPTVIELFAQSLISTPAHAFTQRELHDQKVFESGFTKARPWTDVQDVYGPPWRDGRGVSSHTKGWVDWNFMNGARNVVGSDYPAIAALYAVALQELSDQKASTSEATRAWLGLRTDIADRALATGVHWTADEDELNYLAVIVEGAMHDWVIRSPRANGARMLPMPFRVARAAAAFRDQMPFTIDPCLNPRQHNPVTAGMGGADDRPLCFSDATDRAVYQWFVKQLRREMATVDIPDRHDAARFERAAAPFRQTIFGNDALVPGALRAAFRKEVIDMNIANSLVAEGELAPATASPLIRRAVRRMKAEEN